MAVGTGASGIAGLAMETVAGTYVAPTKYFPFDSESFKYQQDTTWRRPIRATPNVIGAIPGNSHIEGDMTMDALVDIVPYFLYAARTNIVKAGAAPYTYTCTASPVAVPAKTMSLTIVRNGITFGYTGVVVGGFKFTIDGMALKFSVTLMGRDETTQSLPTATWPTSIPFGAGQYKMEIPTTSTVLDTDSFEFSQESNATPQYRLKDTGRGAQFFTFGEDATTLSVQRDFEARTDYDAYKALTSQSITLTCTQSANAIISINLNTAIKDSYEVALGGQGDLIRASVSYIAVANAAGTGYTIIITNTENIV